MPELRRADWLTAAPFAHRGLHDARKGVPENSLAAFDAAIGAGYAIELDVRLSRDGTPMVFHDAKLKRLTGTRGALSARVAAELEALRLGKTEQRIPRLDQALDLVAGRVPVLVEVKNPDDEAGPLEEPVAMALAGYRGPSAILSFNPLSLAWFGRHAPSLLRGLNTSAPDPAKKDSDARTPLGLARRLAQPDFISHDLASLTPRLAEGIRHQGYPLIVWTVRTMADGAKAERHADNFIFEGFRP